VEWPFLLTVITPDPRCCKIRKRLWHSDKARGGGLFKRHWFKFLPHAPPDAEMVAVSPNATAKWVRHWDLADRTVSADIATRAVRKVVKALADHGTDNVVLILQGVLASNNRIEEAGITAQVKAPAGSQPVTT
jgi:hypothetical protein